MIERCHSNFQTKPTHHNSARMYRLQASWGIRAHLHHRSITPSHRRNETLKYLDQRYIFQGHREYTTKDIRIYQNHLAHYLIINEKSVNRRMAQELNRTDEVRGNTNVQIPVLKHPLWRSGCDDAASALLLLPITICYQRQWFSYRVVKTMFW